MAWSCTPLSHLSRIARMPLVPTMARLSCLRDRIFMLLWGTKKGNFDLAR